MAFDLRMRALHCAQQSGNSASNPEQAIRFIPTHFADSERHCSAAANQDGDETDEKNNPERAPWLQCWHCPPLPSRTMRVTAAAASSTCLPLSMVDQPRPAARPSPPCRRARVHVMHEAHAANRLCRRTIHTPSMTSLALMQAATRIRTCGSNCIATTRTTNKLKAQDHKQTPA